MVSMSSARSMRPLPYSIMPCLLLLGITVVWSSTANAQLTSDKPKIKSLAAPAVVGIETGKESGSGFFFRPEGWLLTNYHVVCNAPIDKETARPFVRVTYGTLNATGSIEVSSKKLWASVYRVDRRSDLALLLLNALPEGETSVPFIPFATRAPQDGDNCFALGMPIAGMKWDLRAGTVSSQGNFPDDVTNGRDADLQLSLRQRKQLLHRLAPEGSVKMIVTTCGINPGDSGGPILNDNGELIAVTRAIPQSSQEGISYDKLAYHIHLSELTKFVETLPTTPELPPPFLLPLDAELRIGQAKENEASQYYFANKRTLKSTLCIDLDRDNMELSKSEIEAATEKTEAEFWSELGLEWAIVKGANEPAIHFFDLNQDGQFETVFQTAYDDAGFAVRYSRQNGKWNLDVCNQSFLSDVVFELPETQRRFESLKAQLNSIYTK